MSTPQQITKRTFSPAAYVGQVYARRYGSLEKPWPIGNVLAAELTQKEDVETQPNMTTPGGGIHAERRRVTEVGLSFTIADLNVPNYSRAVCGEVLGVEAGTVTGEAHKVMRGCLLPTANINPKNVVVRKIASGGPATASVTDESHANKGRGDVITLAHAGATNIAIKTGADLANSVPLTMVSNYTAVGSVVTIDANAPGVTAATGFWISYTYPTGTVVSAANYEVRAVGVYVLPEAADLADDEEVVLDYEFDAFVRIQALVNKAAELEFIIDGMNEVDDEKVSIIRVWRASQGVAAKIALLQEKGFANLEVTGSVMMDPTKTGTGISKYFVVEKN